MRYSIIYYSVRKTPHALKYERIRPYARNGYILPRNGRGELFCPTQAADLGRVIPGQHKRQKSPFCDLSAVLKKKSLLRPFCPFCAFLRYSSVCPSKSLSAPSMLSVCTASIYFFLSSSAATSSPRLSPGATVISFLSS